MDSLTLKKELHQYIDRADEKVLTAIYELLKASDFAEGDFELSAEHKKILDERLAAYYANPDNVISWEDIKAKYGKP